MFVAEQASKTARIVVWLKCVHEQHIKMLYNIAPVCDIIISTNALNNCRLCILILSNLY